MNRPPNVNSGVSLPPRYLPDFLSELFWPIRSVCPPVDILEIAKEQRRAMDRIVTIREMSNADPAGLELYEQALWQRTMAGCDIFCVQNLIHELQKASSLPNQ